MLDNRCKNIIFETPFSIEITFTGITRERSAEVAAEFLHGQIERGSNCSVTVPSGRKWHFVYNESVIPLKKVQGSLIKASDDYRVEMLSPMFTHYVDVSSCNELLDMLKKAGAFFST